jgi:hypothetical protein
LAAGEGRQQAGVGVAGGVRALGVGELNGMMLGVESRWSERVVHGGSVMVSTAGSRRCRSGEAAKEEEKGVLHGRVLPL